MVIHCVRQNATIMRQCAIMRPYTVLRRRRRRLRVLTFVKFVTTVFPLRIAEGMLSVTPHGPHQSRTHRGIEQTVTMNSSVRQFFAAPSKTANSKAVSVTRADGERTYVPRSLCSPVPMFPEPMFPGAYVPRYLCSSVPMFPGFCTLIVVIRINRL